MNQKLASFFSNEISYFILFLHALMQQKIFSRNENMARNSIKSCLFFLIK